MCEIHQSKVNPSTSNSLVQQISPKIGQKKRKISHVDLTTPEWTNEDLKLDHSNEPSHQEWAIILIKGCTKSKSSRRHRLSKKKNVGKKASRHSLRCIARRLFPFFTYSPPRPLMTVIPFAFLQPVPAFFHSFPFSEPVAFSPLTYGLHSAFLLPSHYCIMGPAQLTHSSSTPRFDASRSLSELQSRSKPLTGT